MGFQLSMPAVIRVFLIVCISACSDVNKVQEYAKDQGIPGWMNDAVIYEITPYNFVHHGTFRSVTAKLPELKKLGINTIWLQPVTQSSYRGQGYDVVDYFEVNPDLGTEDELHQLVDSAKKLGMRVLFDVVLNHTSIEHPYAKDVIRNGRESDYYDYYQMEMDNHPYSSFYNRNEEGFIHYFWEDLVNLNYDNEKVRQWMIDACKHWVQEYDIDGFRFDAIWGVVSRKPEFIRRLRNELRNIKPDLLMIAEDKGTGPDVYELGFDAAYDWTANSAWISQWAWEYEYHHDKNLTVFNHPDSLKREPMLEDALFGNEENAYRLLRFMGNNDMPHFIQDHTLQQTKMAAGLVFSLPGIPMLYNGQEIGKKGHPYSIQAVFERGRTIREMDETGLFEYYQKLIRLRKKYSALKGRMFRQAEVSSGEGIVAFKRWNDHQQFIIILNLVASQNEVGINPAASLEFQPESDKYHLRDVLSETIYPIADETVSVQIKLNGYSIKWLLLEEK